MGYSAEKVRQSLFALNAKGIKYDLGRITDAAARIGNPQSCLNTIHIAGTNGKGSTSAYIESIIRSAGYRTGLFTSPHLIAFEERFCINGTAITEKDWLDVYDSQQEVISDFKLTFFEATMLIAIELFRRHKVEWAVFETGMGGKLDATNILRPECTVITRIAMDHKEYLGDTIEAIAGEKLGIVKELTPLVIADPDNDTLRKLINETCMRKNTKAFFIAECMASDIQVDGSGISFNYNGLSFTSCMTGRFQVINALCAVEAVKQAGIGVAPEVYQRGIAAMSLPGRFQKMAVGGKIVIVDVGHNPDAAKVFGETLRQQYGNKTVCIVTGIMADKDYGTMMEIYSELAQHIICTQPATTRAALAQTLARLLPEEKRTVCPGVHDAVKMALRRSEEVVAIIGSFYTAGEAICALATEKHSN